MRPNAIRLLFVSEASRLSAENVGYKLFPLSSAIFVRKRFHFDKYLETHPQVSGRNSSARKVSLILVLFFVSKVRREC